MSNDVLLERVIAVVATIAKCDPARLAADTRIFDKGLVDSFGAIELIALLEQTFGLQLSNQDLTQQHFSTPASLAALVAAKTGQA